MDPYIPWIAPAGSIISAIGSTPSKQLNKQSRYCLHLWGNVLQAVGNALESEEQYALERIGTELQASGNVTVVAALLLKLKKETKLQLTIKGNLIQAAGAAAALQDELLDDTVSDRALRATGHLLQIIGNSIQAIGGIYDLRYDRKEDFYKYSIKQGDGKSFDFSGSWIQAVGSVILALGELPGNSIET